MASNGNFHLLSWTLIMTSWWHKRFHQMLRESACRNNLRTCRWVFFLYTLDVLQDADWTSKVATNGNQWEVPNAQDNNTRYLKSFKSIYQNDSKCKFRQGLSFRWHLRRRDLKLLRTIVWSYSVEFWSGLEKSIACGKWKAVSSLQNPRSSNQIEQKAQRGKSGMLIGRVFSRP